MRSEVKIKNQDGGGRYLEFYKNRYNSAKYEPIFMRLDTKIQNHMPGRLYPKTEVENKKQDGSGRHMDFTKISITRPNIHQFS